MRDYLWLLGCVCLAACSEAKSTPEPECMQDAGCVDAAEPEPVADMEHAFPSVTVEGRQELTNECMSWTLNNDEPLWVNTVRADNDGSFHHSNWIFVPDTAYDGPDGVWPCDERGYVDIEAAAMGGVFFAQSTQARSDVQSFPDGVAFEVPARSRVIGQVHFLNHGTEPVDTQIRMSVFTLEESEVQTRLRPLIFTNLGLEIAPLAQTHARMDCDVPDPDFDVYYVLPHYHELGQRMRVSALNDTAEEAEIFTSTAAYGDALGGMIDPPAPVRGASQIRVSCEYDNPRDSTVGYGFGDQEMCVVLIYADTPNQIGGVANATRASEVVNGTHVVDAACLSFQL